MENTNKKIAYVLYGRKSSESREKQVMSLPAQVDWCQKVASQRKLKIDQIFTEERSAEMPGNRPMFDEVVKRIRSGETSGIVCWKLDRLARNPEEAGIILGMLKRGELKHVVTNDRDYLPGDNALISYVDFGMADQYVRDLSKNVKRGLRHKVANGWRPGPAPIGYLNNINLQKGERNIIIDPERHDLILRIFNMYLNEEYSVRKLQAEAIKWGLKTRQARRQGGKPVCLAHIYRILTDPFYAGYFWFKNDDAGEKELIKGAHVPIITMDQYDLIQAKLGRKGKPRPRSSKFFPFTGRIECGECNSMVTAEEKYQTICSECKHKFASFDKKACTKCGTKIADMNSPVVRHYTYYHCTKRKNPKCSQKSVRAEELEKLIDTTLSDFHLSEEFTKWALEELATDNQGEIRSQNAVIEAQQQHYKNVVDRIHNLTTLFTSPENIGGDMLSIEEYSVERKKLLDEKKRLDQGHEEVSKRIEEWMDWAENSFNFAVAARLWFEIGTPDQKRTIFSSLTCSNFILIDKKLNVSLKNPLDHYKNIAEKYPSTKGTLEPALHGSIKGECLPFEADILGLRAR